MGADFQVGTEIRGRERVSKAFNRVAKIVRGPVKRGFMAAGRAAKRLGASIAKATLKVGALGAAAVTAAGVGLWKLVSGVAESGDELAKASKRVGITAQSYAELQHASELAGVSQEEFAKGMETFNKVLGMAEAGVGPLAGLLKKTGPPLLAQLQNAKNNTEALEIMFVAMSQLEKPSQRAALGAAAFGRVGQKMTLMVEGGIEAIDKQRAAFRKYAGTITQESLKASEDFVDAQADTNLAIKGLGFTIGRELLPVLTPMIREFADWIALNREEVGRKVASVIGDIAKWIKGINWSEVVKGVGDFFTGVGQVLKFLWDIKGVILVIAGAAVLGKVVSVVATIVSGAKAMFGWFSKAGTAAKGVAAAQAAGAPGVAGRGIGLGTVAGVGIAAAGVGMGMEALTGALGDVTTGDINDAIKKAQELDALFESMEINIGGKLIENIDAFGDSEIWQVAQERLELLRTEGVEAARRGMGIRSKVASEQLMELLIPRLAKPRPEAAEVKEANAEEAKAETQEIMRRQEALQQTVATFAPAAAQQGAAVNETLGKLNRTLERLERNPPRAQVAVTVAAAAGTTAAVVPPAASPTAAVTATTGMPAVRATP